MVHLLYLLFMSSAKFQILNKELLLNICKCSSWNETTLMFLDPIICLLTYFLFEALCQLWLLLMTY